MSLLWELWPAPSTLPLLGFQFADDTYWDKRGVMAHKTNHHSHRRRRRRDRALLQHWFSC